MEKCPEISVVLGSFDPRPERLERAVRSLLDQSFPAWELVLWDDGSSPAGAAALRRQAGRDRRVRLFRGGENRGLGYGLNRCLERARGRYIARMDDDDVAFPQRLQVQRDFLEGDGRFQWVGSAAVLLDGRGPWGLLQMPPFPREEDFLRSSPYIHPSVMFRREALERAGGYRESRRFFGCEDYELFIRLHTLGLRGRNLEEPLLGYWEDRASHARRGFPRRLREAALRRRGFRALGLTGPRAAWGVVRPLAAGLLPAGARYRVRRWQRGGAFGGRLP